MRAGETLFVRAEGCIGGAIEELGSAARGYMAGLAEGARPPRAEGPEGGKTFDRPNADDEGTGVAEGARKLGREGEGIVELAVEVEGTPASSPSALPESEVPVIEIEN